MQQLRFENTELSFSGPECKQFERKQIEEDTRQFLSQGGQIQHLPCSSSGISREAEVKFLRRLKLVDI